jgi:ribonuclease P protein component
MVTNNKFSKHEKLKSKIAIDTLFSKGKSINEYPIRLVFLPKEEASYIVANVGVVVPKKQVRLAVNRNLIKRRLREAYRLNNNELKTVLKKNDLSLNMMFIYSNKQILDYTAIEDKIKVILTRLIEQCEVAGK